MNKRKFILATGLYLLTLFCFAQNNEIDPLQTGNSIGALFPELNGWHGSVQLGGFTKQQFTGFEGRPQTYTLQGDAYIPKTKSSIGVFINREILGQWQTSVASINYTQRITIGELHFLPSVGYAKYQYSVGICWNKKAPNFIRYQGNQINGGLGMIYKKWFGALHYLGVVDYNSPPQVQISGNQAWTSTWKTQPIYSMVFGRSIVWKDWTFHKNAMIRSNLSSAQIDLNFNAAYKRFMAGASYSFTDVIKFGFGYDILERYRISYATPISIRRVFSIGNRSHEFAFRILLNKKTDHRILSDFGLF